MAQLFFSAEAQAALAARGEPPPKWAYMADDDSFAFTSSSSPSSASAIPTASTIWGTPSSRRRTSRASSRGSGSRRLATAAPGSPSRAARRAAIRYSTPASKRTSGTGRATRASRSVWSTPASSSSGCGPSTPGATTIINKKKPPPGSIPIGLTLPPLSFHHVDADALVALERAQIVRDASRPRFYDFGPLALQPVAATGGGAGGQLPSSSARWRRDQGPRPDRVWKELGSFALDGGGGGGSGLRFVQRFSGDECRDRTASADEKYFTGSLAAARRETARRIVGGGGHPLRAVRVGWRRCRRPAGYPCARTSCPTRAASASSSPSTPAAARRLLLRRLGLDMARRRTPPTSYATARRRRGAAGCARQAPPACATVAVPAGGAANFTLWTRALSGVAALSVARLAVGGGGGIVGARVVGASHALFPGRAAAPVRELVTSSSSTLVQRGLAAVEPAAVPIVIELSCAQRGRRRARGGGGASTRASSLSG